MPFLFILGNFNNKSAKPRVPKCRAVLSGREPGALLQRQTTSASHQVAGVIWMPDSHLEPLLQMSLSYTVHDTAPILYTMQLLVRGKQYWDAAETPKISMAYLKMGFAGGGNRQLHSTCHLLHPISHLNPMRLAGRHQAPILGDVVGPALRLTAMLLSKTTALVQIRSLFM